MTAFVFTPLAETDLEQIVDYIARESGPDRADSVLFEILTAAARLAEMPGIGHARREITRSAVLFWPVHSWLIVYRPRTHLLQIVRVVSGLRDLPALLEMLPD